jgi:predicted hydrocarbon binding protein
MNFFEMLMISRKMQFEDGKIKLYGQDIAIIPAPPIIEYIRLINDDDRQIKLIYSTAKESMLDYKQEIMDATKGLDSKWISDTMNLYSHGKMRYEEPSLAPLGIVSLENSAPAKILKTKVEAPVDHIFRGILAGLTSVICKRDIDVIETSCYVVNGNLCKFSVNDNAKLKENFQSLYEKQIS